MQVPSALLLASVWGLQPAGDDRGYAGPQSVDAEPGEGEAPPAEVDDAELSLEDVFGSEADHADVEEAAEDASVAAQGEDKRAKFLDDIDTRFRILTSGYLDIHRTDTVGWGRNENRLEFYFAYTPNEHIEIVGDIEGVFMGVAQAQELDDLATRRMLTPFHFESDAAYVGVLDALPGLDLKIGRQIVVWGTADKFNPTNNINPDDLEDRPLFTEPIANQMVVLDYAPLGDRLWFQGVYVPLFYPALLPPSASAALKDPRSPVPFARDEEQTAIDVLQEKLEIQPELVPDVIGHVVMPEVKLTNGQAAAKVGTRFGEWDLSASYYYGRHDIPAPVNVESTMVVDSIDPLDYPDDVRDDVLVEECCFVSDVFLVYPKMQVVGLDFATQLGFLGNMGLWGEAGLFFPDAKDLRIELPVATDITPDDGEVNPVFEFEGPTIRSTPFVKATAGLDYTFGKHVYVQGQYLRGFIDEFGVDHIGNYGVAGTDLIFFGRHLIVRVFGVVGKAPRDTGVSGVVYPALLMTPPWGYVTFELGSFVLLGDDHTKFGQKAAGTSIAFLKAIGTF